MANKCYVLLYEDGSTEISELSWNEVQKIPRKGVKGFKSVKEAREFINNGGWGNDAVKSDPKPVKQIKKDKGVVEYEDYVKTWLKENPYAFTDGSYNIDTHVYGCGGFLVVNNEKFVIQASGINPEMSSMRNVAGEILGAMKALEMAVEKGVTHLTLFYDYEGIQKWVDGSWQAKNENTQYYRDFVRGLMDLGLTIDFVHSTGHTGIDGNEEADKLAKEAVGIAES